MLKGYTGGCCKEEPAPKWWKRCAKALAYGIAMGTLYLLGGVAIIVTLPLWILLVIYAFLIRPILERFTKKEKQPEKPYVEPKPKVLKIRTWECDRPNIPFDFSTDYFVYIETGYHETMNNYIRQHIGEIRDEAAKRRFKFVYIPEIADMTKEELANTFPTYADTLTDNAYDKLRHITTEQFTKALMKTIGIRTTKCRCGFLRLIGRRYQRTINFLVDTDVCLGLGFEFADFYFQDKSLIETAMADMYEFFLDKDNQGLYSTGPADKYSLSAGQRCEELGDGPDQADAVFDEERQKMEMIAEEIRTRIEVLKQGGYMELLMHTIGEDLVRQLSNTPKRSSELPRIKITDNLKIVMPELDNREVKMPALARALYIFFLRHEEGLEFKQLPNFENEIFAIYRLASNRTDETKLHATVAQLVNPTENKVNECASRIKEGFVKIMDDYQARNYYLTQRCMNYTRPNLYEKKRTDYFSDLIKKVALPRTLVEYPQCLIDLPKDMPKDLEDRVLANQEYDHRVSVMRELMENHKQKGYARGPKKLHDAVQAVLDMDSFNYLAHFHMGHLCCNKKEYATSIKENTIVLEHDDYLWNMAYINRAEAYLYAKEYDKGLADIDSYFNSLRRNKASDMEAMRIRILLKMHSILTL